MVKTIDKLVIQNESETINLLVVLTNFFTANNCMLNTYLVQSADIIVDSCFRLLLLDEMEQKPVDEEKFLEIIKVGKELTTCVID